MKQLSLITFFLVLGLSGFAQTKATPKNILTINPFRSLRLYNPAIQFTYTRNLANNFAIKITYDHIIKHSLLTWGIYDQNDRRSENTHKGYVLSIEFMKKVSRIKKENHLFLGVALFYRKASSNITAASNELLISNVITDYFEYLEYRNGPLGFSDCGSSWFCLVENLDRFEHHKKDYGINFLVHYPVYIGKKKRLLLDYQTGIGIFYRNSYHVGRDYKNFNRKLNAVYLSSGKQILLNFPITMLIGYRF